MHEGEDVWDVWDVGGMWAGCVRVSRGVRVLCGMEEVLCGMEEVLWGVWH